MQKVRGDPPPEQNQKGQVAGFTLIKSGNRLITLAEIPGDKDNTLNFALLIATQQTG